MSPFSPETAVTLARLRDDQGRIWQITLSRMDAGRVAKDRYRPAATRGVTWTCILRWPDRMVRGHGPSAEEAMRVALREGGVED